MTMINIATPSATHSKFSAPVVSTRNSPAPTQNIPATPAAITFFNPFIFPPAAAKQAQPRTPTYQNMPTIVVTFTHTATSTPTLIARAVSMSIRVSLQGDGGEAERGERRPTVGSPVEPVKQQSDAAFWRRFPAPREPMCAVGEDEHDHRSVARICLPRQEAR